MKAKYRIDVDGGGYWGGGQTWDCEQYGKPTDAALLAWVLGHFRSLEVGGVNGHIGRQGRFASAHVVRQGTRTRPDVVVAVWPTNGTASGFFARVDAEMMVCLALGMGLCPRCGPAIVAPADKARTGTGFTCCTCGTPAAGP
jgi:hypothetical protein